MVQSGHREQRGDAGVVGVQAAVGQDQDVDAVVDQLGRAVEQAFHGRLDVSAPGGIVHPIRQFVGHAVHDRIWFEKDGQGRGLEPRDLHPADLLQIAVADDRRVQLDHPAAFRLRIQQVALGAKEGDAGRDDGLANGINRRIRDLREQLLEVVVEQLRAVGQDGQRRVVAHGSDRLHTRRAHRPEDEAHVLEGVAEGQHALVQGLGVDAVRLLRFRQLVDLLKIVLQPLAVRILGGDRALDLGVVDDATLLGVDQEHAARLEAALVGDVGGIHIQHADLGAHDHAVVLGDVITRRTQAVAVEHRADANAVREGDRGGAVPRFDLGGRKLIVVALLVGHVFVILPGLGDHHHDRFLEGAAAEDEEFQAVVEHRRVAAAFIDDRQQLLQVVAEDLALAEGLAGVHPGDVAAQGVDIAVVAEMAEWLGAGPAGKGVGAEARVRQRHGGIHLRIGQVRKIGSQLLRGEHALVDHRPARHRADVEPLAALEIAVADAVGGDAVDHVELALEFHDIGHVGAAADERLSHQRLTGGRGLAQHAVVDRHGAPTEERQTLLLHDLLEDLLNGGALLVVLGEEDEADAVLAFLRELDALLLAGGAEEIVGDLHEDPGAVARAQVAAAAAAVVQSHADLQRALHDVMRLAALDIDHKADAAGIPLVIRVVEPLLRREIRLLLLFHTHISF